MSDSREGGVEDENSEGSPFAFPRDGGGCIPRHFHQFLKDCAPTSAPTTFDNSNQLSQLPYTSHVQYWQNYSRNGGKRCRWTGPAPTYNL